MYYMGFRVGVCELLLEQTVSPPIMKPQYIAKLCSPRMVPHLSTLHEADTVRSSPLQYSHSVNSQGPLVNIDTGRFRMLGTLEADDRVHPAPK